MKKIISLFLCIYLTLLCFVSSYVFAADISFAPIYRDVKSGIWYESYAVYCFEHGYMKGTAKGTFSPNTNITRAMAVTVLCNMNTKEPYFEPHGFSDVKEDQWYYESVEWAYYNGITSGTGNNKFSPDKAITRQDFITLLYNYDLKYSHTRDIEARDYDPFGYIDITDVSDYAEDAIDWAIKYRIIKGFTDCSLRPLELITRTEAATIIYNYENSFGHAWQKTVITRRDCENQGEAKLLCNDCGEERTVYTDAYHLWSSTVTANPTCTKNGNKRTSCSVCNKCYDETLAAFGHSWKYVKDVKPTSAAQGFTLYRCANCQSEKKDNFKTFVSGDSNKDGKLTIDEYLGIGDISATLTQHLDDYLGTKYVPLATYPDKPWLLLRDKGRYKTSSMNCTGFVAAVVERSGGDLSKISTYGQGAYANGFNWQRTIEGKGIYRYKFNTVNEALKSGKMRKGDIIYFVPPAGSDCHLGIFWGDTPYDNKIIHCTCPSSYNRSSGVKISGVQISGISSGTPYSYFYVLPMQGER